MKISPKSKSGEFRSKVTVVCTAEFFIMASLAEEEETVQKDEAGADAAAEKEDEDEGDEEESEDEEDPRIGKLAGFARKHTVEETVELLTSKIGGDSFKPAVIGSSSSPPHHIFVVPLHHPITTLTLTVANNPTRTFQARPCVSMPTMSWCFSWPKLY